MDKTTHQSLSDEEIHALLDGQVPSGALSALEIRLSHDPAAQATLLKWQQQRLALKQLYQGGQDEPVPSSLKKTVTPVQKPKKKASWARWGGIAASVLLSFAVGWLSHSAWLTENGSQPRTQPLALVPAQQSFAHQATVAHAMYSPEVRHPVVVTASEQDHLVKWLSTGLTKSLTVPKLSEMGFELVGGRLLPGDSGARAQLMFQKADGLRITLYSGAVNEVSGATNIRETTFMFMESGSTPCVYWVDQGFGYAVIGALPRAELLQLAEAVYHQR